MITYCALILGICVAADTVRWIRGRGITVDAWVVGVSILAVMSITTFGLVGFGLLSAIV